MTDPNKFKSFIEEFGRHTSGCGQKFLEKNPRRYLHFLRDDYNVQFHNKPLAKTVDYLIKSLAESTKATSKRMAEDMNNKSFHDMITGNKDRPTIRDVRAVIDNATLRDSVDDAPSRGLRAGHIASSFIIQYVEFQVSTPMVEGDVVRPRPLMDLDMSSING